jgi:hypothetical protein
MDRRISSQFRLNDVYDLFYFLMMILVLLISSFVKINKGAFEMGTQKSSLNSIIV